jgi:hypothetical protein
VRGKRRATIGETSEALWVFSDGIPYPEYREQEVLEVSRSFKKFQEVLEVSRSFKKFQEVSRSDEVGSDRAAG